MGRHLRIGMFGFGCVGQGLYDVLHRTKGIKAEIARICVKDYNKVRPISMDHFTFDRNEILQDPGIDLIVELIDNADDAFEIVTQSMRSGKAVVTANKKMVAEHFDELFALQHECGTPFLYEASCCGSIPIIRNLEEYYDNDLLHALEGIVNGTTNYILSQMFREGKSYEETLVEAQALGFAESNPYLDVAALDAKFKLCILTAHAFGVFLEPQSVFNYGIQTISRSDMQYAREKGCQIKLTARSTRIPGEGPDTLGVWVMPQLVPQENKLFQVNREYNGIVVKAAFSDEQFFMGKGAGSHPTGSAVLSDISAMTYQYRYEYKKYHQNSKPVFSNNIPVEIYCRYADENVLSELEFTSIEERYSGRDYKYVIGTVSLDALMSSQLIHNPDTFVAMTAGN